MSNTTKLETIVTDSTEYGNVYARIYNNELLQSVELAHSSPIINKDRALSLYDKDGVVVYCPYGSSFDSNQFIEFPVSESGTIGVQESNRYDGLVYYIIGDDYSHTVCNSRLSANQTSDLAGFITSKIDFSNIDASNMRRLFGPVSVFENNKTITNTHHTVPNNCNISCPLGTCLESMAKQEPFTITNTHSHSSFKESFCKRNAIMYLAYKNAVSNDKVVTDEQLKSIEDPCGAIILICPVGNPGSYRLISVLNFNGSNVISSHLNAYSTPNRFTYNISLGEGDSIICVDNPIDDGFEVERFLYIEGNCSDFEENSCLRRSRINRFGFSGLVNINNTETIDNYIEQDCLVPVCGPDHCPETPTTPESNRTYNNVVNNSIIAGGVVGAFAFLTISICTIFASLCAIFRWKKAKSIKYQNMSKKYIIKNILNQKISSV